MIYSLTGKVIALDQNGLAVQCGGIAFFCFSTMNTLKNVAINTETTVYTADHRFGCRSKGGTCDSFRADSR